MKPDGQVRRKCLPLPLSAVASLGPWLAPLFSSLCLALRPLLLLLPVLWKAELSDGCGPGSPVALSRCTSLGGVEASDTDHSFCLEVVSTPLNHSAFIRYLMCASPMLMHFMHDLV